jgi:hypothetical protein
MFGVQTNRQVGAEPELAHTSGDSHFVVRKGRRGIDNRCLSRWNRVGVGLAPNARGACLEGTEDIGRSRDRQELNRHCNIANSTFQNGCMNSKRSPVVSWTTIKVRLGEGQGSQRLSNAR